MRHPFRKIWIWLGLTGLSALTLWIGAQVHDRHGEGVLSFSLIAASLTIGPLAAASLINALMASIAYARLKGGHGEIARWTVSRGEWRSFRAYDHGRSALGEEWVSTLEPRDAKAGGVEVIFGRKAVILDEALHSLDPRGFTELRAVQWLAPPGTPEIIEFGSVYIKNKRGDLAPVSLRVPVAEDSRGEASLVVRHFRSIIPEQRAVVPLAVRHPRLALGLFLGVGAAALLFALAAKLMDADVEWVLGGVVTGVVTLGGALVLALILLWTRLSNGPPNA